MGHYHLNLLKITISKNVKGCDVSHKHRTIKNRIDTMSKKVTNLVMAVSYDGVEKWKDRFLLGDSREEFYRLCRDAEAANAAIGEVHPIQVFGPDGLEWQDDLTFLLDRCFFNFYNTEDDWPSGLLEFGTSLLDWNCTSEGEERTYVAPDGRMKIVITADCTPMVGGRLGVFGS